MNHGFPGFTRMGWPTTEYSEYTEGGPQSALSAACPEFTKPIIRRSLRPGRGFFQRIPFPTHLLVCLFDSAGGPWLNIGEPFWLCLHRLLLDHLGQVAAQRESNQFLLFMRSPSSSLTQ